jgi:hypothetical protein
MSELPDTVENRLMLLSEVNTRLGNLIQFTIEHPHHWTPAEIEDYPSSGSLGIKHSESSPCSKMA